MNPKVFISHASEDKDRFVLRFAERLRSNGIDAWLDKWEMLPGDSLVDKIFEEGIRDAAAVIVVLSMNSVDKPWVKEEINAAFVKRVNTGSKLIPIVLDDCIIPEALKSTVWERIADIQSYDIGFERILASILGLRDKPPLGELPSYVDTSIHDIEDMARIDNLVLRTICELALKSGHDNIEEEDLLSSQNLSSVPLSDLRDSLEILAGEYLVTLTYVIGPKLPRIRLTLFGFQKYASKYISDYGNIVSSIAFQIVNQGLSTNNEIQRLTGKPIFLVNHVLELLEQKDYIKLSKYFGGVMRVLDVTPKLKRSLSDTK